MSDEPERVEEGGTITVTFTDEQAGALYKFVAFPNMSMNTPVEAKAREAINVLVAAVRP